MRKIGLMATFSTGLAALCLTGSGAFAQSQNISRPKAHEKRSSGTDAPATGDIRSINGYGNNLTNPEYGAAHTPLFRMAPNGYDDGVSMMREAGLKSPREISNLVIAQHGESILNTYGTSDWIWQWGQFLDHDYALSDGIPSAGSANIPVPSGDAFFDPAGTGTQTIHFDRAIFDTDTGITSPRQQINEITSFIDGSNVYGSNEARALELRRLDGTGRLKTSAGNLLPFNLNNFPNANGPAPDPTTLFLAGDVRANEQVALASIQTLWVREHNRRADAFAAANPNASDEEIYQHARRIVGAEIQKITYEEFLPALLDAKFPKYRGYDDTVNPTLRSEFSGAAYRFGHTALSPKLLFAGPNGEESYMALRDVFFNAPQILNSEASIEPILRGLAGQRHQRLDSKIVDDVRNFLFGPPGAGGFDLASLNIQRGRDRGLPDYNSVRRAYGLSARNSFSEISSDPDVVAALGAAYTSVDDIDLWVGGLAEDSFDKSQLGETFTTILMEQFMALRDGDRFWYQRHLSKSELTLVKNVTLGDIIEANTSITGLQENVFYVIPAKGGRRRQ